MFILSSTSSSLVWSANHSLIYENSELKVFTKINFLCEMSNNWPNDLLGINAYRLLNFVDVYCWQNYNALILLQ